MTQHSKECKQSWIEADILAINSAIEVSISAKIVTIHEFAYTVCSLCPYMCGSCMFCWCSYVNFRYENNGQNYKNIMKVLINAFYNETKIDTFNFFRTKICKACEKNCKKVYLGTHCTEQYLNQVKGELPRCYKRNIGLVPKKATFPQVLIDGDTISEIINRLWKQDDKINSEERAYLSED